MKKHLTWLMAAVLLTGMATSCSDDEPAPAASDGTVTFTLALPAGIGSRAYSDGLTATKLTYAVYDASAAAGTAPVIFNQEKTFTDKQTTVELKLVTGRTYDILFWADSYGSDATNSPYTFSPTGQTITVDYAKFNSNSDNYDAFFAARTALKVAGPVDETITLTRPFAQVNFGTDDLAEPAVQDLADLKASVATTAYTKLNLLTGEASEPAAVTFGFDPFPTTESFPYEPAKYQYVAMNYLLVPADKETLDALTLTVQAAGTDFNTVAVPNAPVQRNYRTNIYGSLLTSTALFNIVIDPIYSDPDYSVDIPTEGLAIIGENNYEVSSANGLAYLAAQEGGISGTVTVTDNIDLASLAKYDSDGYLTSASKININSETTLDLGGNTLTVAKNQLQNYSTLTVKNGTMTTADAEYVINNNAGATLNIEGGTYTTGKSGGDGCVIFNAGTLNISDGTIQGYGYSIKSFTNTTLNITGGKILTNNVNTAYAVVVGNNSTGNISGGTVQGLTVYKSTVDITGGTIFQNSKYYAIYVESASASTINIANAYICSLNNTDIYPRSATLNITSGYFNDNAAALPAGYQYKDNVQTIDDLTFNYEVVATE